MMPAIARQAPIVKTIKFFLIVSSLYYDLLKMFTYVTHTDSHAIFSRQVIYNLKQ